MISQIHARISQLVAPLHGIKREYNRGSKEDKIGVLFQAIESVTGITKQQMKGRRRKTEIVEARHIFCHISVKALSLQITETGRQLGRDHTTALNSIERASNFLDTNELDFIEKYNRVLNIVKLIINGE